MMNANYSKECSVPKNMPTKMVAADDIGYDDRTEDVIIKENLDFELLIYEEKLLKGLLDAGFIKPSPIQLAAIPKAFCGCDLIIQAKSGTGKSCVFVLTALKKIKIHKPDLQAIIIAPSREISVQNKNVILTIGKYLKGLKVEYFIGGTPIADDIKKSKGCHIAVGAPGRLNHLIKDGYLNTKSVNLIVFDEADKLMEDSFIKVIWEIHCACPAEKQVIACSATFTTELFSIIKKYTKNGVHITPGMKPELVLFGVKQFVSIIDKQISSVVDFNNKVKWLSHLLSVVKFNQCIIFTNYNLRVTKIYSLLKKENWGVSCLNSKLSQDKRIAAYNNLKTENAQILITTDVSARGIDVKNVNLVINFDIPHDYVTYLHRMGRAGRFGSYGMVINIIQKGEELSQFQTMLQEVDDTFSIYILPRNGVSLDSVCDCETSFQKLNIKIAQDKSDSSSDEVINFNGNNELNINKTNIKVKETCEKQNRQVDNDIDCITAIQNNLDSLVLIGCECKKLEIDPKSVILDDNETLYTLDKEFQMSGTLFPVSKCKLPLNVPVIEVDGKLVSLIKSEKVTLQYKSISHDETDIEILMQEKSNKNNIKSLKKQTMTKSLTLIEKLESPNYVIKEKAHEMQSIHEENRKRNIKILELCSVIKQYDLLGWLSVEEDCNLVNNIQEQNPDIFKLNLTKCERNKLHIKTSKLSKLDKFLLNKDENIISNHVNYALDMTNLPPELLNQSFLDIVNCFGTYEVSNKSLEIKRYNENNSIIHNLIFENISATQNSKYESDKNLTEKCYSTYVDNTSVKHNSKNDMNAKCDKYTSHFNKIGNVGVKGKFKNTSNKKHCKKRDLNKLRPVSDYEQSNESLYSTDSDGMVSGLHHRLDNWIPVNGYPAECSSTSYGNAIDYPTECSSTFYHNTNDYPAECSSTYHNANDYPAECSSTYHNANGYPAECSSTYHNANDYPAECSSTFHNANDYPAECSSTYHNANNYPAEYSSTYHNANDYPAECSSTSYDNANSVNNISKQNAVEDIQCSELQYSTNKHEEGHRIYYTNQFPKKCCAAAGLCNCCPYADSSNNVFKRILEYDQFSELSFSSDSEDGIYYTTGPYLNCVRDEDNHSAVCSSTFCDGGKSVNNIFKWISKYNHFSESSFSTDSEDR